MSPFNPERTVGRKPMDYETKQVRVPTHVADLWGKMAGLQNMSVPEMLDQKFPEFLAEYQRLLAEEQQRHTQQPADQKCAPGRPKKGGQQ